MIADFTPVDKQTVEKILSSCKTKFSEPSLNDVWKVRRTYILNLYSELRIQFAKYYLCYYPFEKKIGIKVQPFILQARWLEK